MNVGISGNGFNIALGGLQNAAKRLDESAQRVAGGQTQTLDDIQKLGSRDVDPVQEAVHQKIATYDFKANLKSLEAQSKMQEEVIDILA